ncbi:MAG: hypothetical protein O2897_06185 [bacterium]|nr:hypothetical protein [bacterium]
MRKMHISCSFVLLITNLIFSPVNSAPVVKDLQTSNSSASSSGVLKTTDPNYWDLRQRRFAKPLDNSAADFKDKRRKKVARAPSSSAPVTKSGTAPLHTIINREILPSLERRSVGNYPFPYTRYQTSILTKVYPESTIGKLFVTIGDHDYVCSASVIRNNLLITARHCIYDYETNRWATNVVFYPGYDNGANLKLSSSGGWAARQLFTWTSDAESFRYDIAFIQTYNYHKTGCASKPGNHQIAEYTGYLGYKYGGSYEDRHIDVFGYPQSSPFSGRYPYQCETIAASFNADNTFGVGCDFTGGSSGGPWLDQYRLGESGDYNRVTSVTSFKWTGPNGALSINGPEFEEDNFFNLLEGALALDCP